MGYRGDAASPMLSSGSPTGLRPDTHPVHLPGPGRDADYLAVVDSHDRLVDGHAKLS